MRLKQYLNDAYTVIKPIQPKPDKKSWSQLGPYETKKVKEYLKSKKLKVTDVYRILGTYDSHNLDYEKQTNVSFETLDSKRYDITINLKTGKVTDQ